MKPSRLVLFDIDGTILGTSRTIWPDPVKEVMEMVLKEAGIPQTIDTSQYRQGGKTDPQIFYDILGLNGLSEEKITLLMPRLREAYLKALRDKITQRPDYIILKPGVEAIIQKLHEHPEVLMGLLTGNFEEGARLKLQPHNLNQYFPFGAYGDGTRQRSDLPQRGLDAAEKYAGHRFSAKEIVLIGDTPNDIHCGRHLNVRVIAVATSNYSLEVLKAENPDYVFPDLTDTEKVLNAVLEHIN
ncbi:MAG TPA: HAD family hydrolase [bacterium]|nr:HAD family hydrolase [bacterium]